MNSGSHPQAGSLAGMLLRTSPSFLLSRVYASHERRPLRFSSKQDAKSVFVNGCPCSCSRHINSPSELTDFLLRHLRKELAGNKSKVVASNVNSLLACISLHAKDDVEEISSDVPSCRAKAVECVRARFSQETSLRPSFPFDNCSDFEIRQVVIGGTDMESGFCLNFRHQFSICAPSQML